MRDLSGWAGADFPTALASATRRHVLAVLADSSEALDAGSIAERVGLHVTTARFHLDQLVAAGLVDRRRGSERRRGRPRILYLPAEAARDDDSRDQLIDLLAAALDRTEGHVEESLQAGRQWAAHFESPAADAPLPGLVDVLDRLGFEPEAEAELIRLHACPFRGAAREHPDVVCSVHRGLIDQLLEHTVMESQLMPMVEPELCLVALASRAES